jgi:ribosomal protein S18 acetylase RimI-like enzyme
MIHIRPYQETDWPAVWAMLQATCRAGEAYAFSPDIAEADMRQIWVGATSAVFVAVDGDEKENSGAILGSSFIKPNQPGLGNHVSNCGYVVTGAARGRGVATRLCEHSQQEAIARGYRAMQFNFVISSNTAAVNLWKKLGFAVVGVSPKAFRHAQLGLVDALVMYKELAAEG